MSEEAALIQAMYFGPLAYGFYLLAVLVVMTVYYQIKWSRICRANVRVLVRKADGYGKYDFAPRTGGSVSLKNPHNNSVRVWPINELCTINVPYPDSGFLLPPFLQKQIQMVIVDEDDWEPLLNRSPYMQNVASPDLVDMLRDIADDADEQTKARLSEVLEHVSSAPTREIIGSPAVLGNLLQERISEIIMTISRDVFDRLAGIIKKLETMVTPTMFYIGMGLVGILVIVAVYYVIMVAQQNAAIMGALGIQ